MDGFKPHSEPLVNMAWTQLSVLTLPHPMALPPASSPGSLPLTLHLLVLHLPLQVDGRCSLVDKALETGILALLHCDAGWLNGDDRAPEAWMESKGPSRGSVGWPGYTQVGQAWAPGPLPHSRHFPILTVGRPRTGWDCDDEGSFMLGVGATNHLAHIFARVGRGDVVEPQQGAMGLPERKRRRPSRVLR